MRLLILGGTKFLGRHIVDAALARGHAVTLFTRGQRDQPWGKQLCHLHGDRDPKQSGGLAALAQGEWDAVIDTSGYLPRLVQASVDLLRGRVGQYLFVSSLSAYARPALPNLDEAAPLAVLDEPESEDIARHYGALKAACEQIVQAAFPAPLLIRPGLIVGPHDATDRFAYWVARFCAPHLLGERGRQALLPAPPSRPLQLIDARDLAAWFLSLLETGQGGIFNACSPAGALRMQDLVDRLQMLAVPGLQPVWVDEAVLAAQQVGPWQELPLWIPASDQDNAGFMRFDTRKAQQQGLSCRPLACTIADTAQWLQQRDPTDCWRTVLSDAREQAVLAAARQTMTKP